MADLGVGFVVDVLGQALVAGDEDGSCMCSRDTCITDSWCRIISFVGVQQDAAAPSLHGECAMLTLWDIVGKRKDQWL